VSKLLCVGVRRGYSSDLRLNVVRLTATEAFLDDGSVPEDIDGATFLHVSIMKLGNSTFPRFIFKVWRRFCPTEKQWM
jgi:hypothetical protein